MTSPLRDAESATAGVPVVRGLEWSERSSVPDGAWSETMLAQRRGHHNLGRYAGSYSVQELMPGGKWGWWNSWTSDHHPEGVEDTEEAAQAACQADFNQRITTALNPDFLSELDTARAEIEGWRKRYDDSSDYSIDLQRIIEDLTHSRPIREPQTTAHFHYDMAVAYQSALTAAQARIAELEGDRYAAHEIAADLRDRTQMADAQRLVLLTSPMPGPTSEPTNSPLSPVKENDRG